jgi:hypothetical protein
LLYVQNNNNEGNTKMKTMRYNIIYLQHIPK